MPIVTVRTKETVEKFGRAGLRFTREPTTLEVTEEQLAMLRVEPMLEIVAGSAPARSPAPAQRAVPAPAAAADDDADTAEKRRPGRK